MARYEDLTNEELQAKAEAAGIARAGSLTRDQLIAQLARKGDTGRRGKSRLVTPVVGQGSEPSGTTVAPPPVAKPATEAEKPTGEAPKPKAPASTSTT